MTFTRLILLLFSSILYAEAPFRNWEAIGPIGGGTPIHSFAPSPSQTNLVYAFSGRSLFKSNDAGLTWTETNSQRKFDSSSNLRIDSENPQLLYASHNGTLLITRDGGKNWDELYPDIAVDVQSFFNLNPQPLTQVLKILVYTKV